MLRRDAKIDTALALSGKTVCTQSATTTELNLADYFRANNMSLSVATFPTAQEARMGYDEKKCDVLTSDVSQLYAERLKMSAPDTHVILPEVISKEPWRALPPSTPRAFRRDPMAPSYGKATISGSISSSGRFML